MSQTSLNRRTFLFASTAALGVANFAQGKVRKTTLAKSGFQSPNEKLNIASIGVGGKGRSDVNTCNTENIVALCDVDRRRLEGTAKQYPRARKYQDFRELLDEGSDIDACTITTPDHMHAVIAMRCMNAGKHVYVQKPLTHTVHEARILRQTANALGLATQMGNQGAATAMHREVAEMIWAGLIGQVREVHSWTDRPKGWWPQGIAEPLPQKPVPDFLDWDIWQGPAPVRPYNPGYCPFKWRGWWDYGCGALGDIACHNLSPVVKALQLEYPISVECFHAKKLNEQTFPIESKIRYRFPQRGNFAPLVLYWYDGKLKPDWPSGVPKNIDLFSDDTGTMFIGDDGIIVMKGKLNTNWLIQDGQLVDYDTPRKILPRLPKYQGKEEADRMHKIDWIRSCKTGSKASSNFDHAGPLTEWVVMGNLSLKFPNRRLDWDGPAMRFTNCDEANQFVTKEYRKGWELLT